MDVVRCNVGQKSQPLISRGFFVMLPEIELKPGLNSPPSIILVADFGDKSATTQCTLAMERSFRNETSPNSTLPNVHVVDDLAPFDIIGGAFALYRVSRQAPNGSVFVAVVDPGVGTDRNIVSVRTKEGSTYIGPNNGVLSPIARKEGIESVHVVDPERFTTVTSTFHGRDIMSPLAGQIASGRSVDEFGELADPLDLVGLRVPYGRILWTDPNYGNIKVWAGVPNGASRLVFRNGHVDEHRVPIVNTFGDVEIGSPLAYDGSDQLLEIAVREGSAQAHFGIQNGSVLGICWE